MDDTYTKDGLPAAMSARDVEVVKKERVWSGYFHVDRYLFRHRLYRGGWTPPFMREIFERGHAVAVLLYDRAKDRMVLIEQFRPGAYVAACAPHVQHAFSPWLIEIVAGIIDEGEAPEDVARREAVEEAGCTIGELLPITTILASPGGSTETIVLFLGYIDAPGEGGVHGLHEEHEDIRVLVASPDEVWGWIDDGRIVNGPTLVGLQWFRIHQEQLRARR